MSRKSLLPFAAVMDTTMSSVSPRPLCSVAETTLPQEFLDLGLHLVVSGRDMGVDLRFHHYDFSWRDSCALIGALVAFEVGAECFASKMQVRCITMFCWCGTVDSIANGVPQTVSDNNYSHIKGFDQPFPPHRSGINEVFQVH